MEFFIRRILFSTLIFLLSCILIFVIFLQPSFQRKPELPLFHLVKAQEKALPDYWEASDKSNWEIFTDTDLTMGKWAVFLNYEYRNGADRIRQEIHVSPNPNVAKLLYKGIYLGEDILVPEEWTFQPEYAQHYEVGCTHYKDIIISCQIILLYQEYIFVIRTPIRGYLKFTEFEEFLSVTDQFMHNFITNSALIRQKRSVPATIDDLW